MTDALLSRLEALKEPSREIDAEIALATGYRWPEEAPRYTESLDAALTLKGDGFYLRHLDETPYGWTATIADKATDKMWQETDGPTPAIALLIAIMKAKESAPPSEDK